LHDTYDGPKPPTIQQAMTVVEEAYERGLPLRHGSANQPRYERITDARWAHIVTEFNKTKRFQE
jgi:hypothetical protein